MKNIIICEKPSVARTIMSYLGGFTNHSDKGIGYGESDEWIVTWCFGHLITMCYPEDYDESLKTWSLDALPFLPDTYKYRPIQDTIKQFEIIKTIYHRTDVRTLYYCPDPAREGVLIQHLVRQMAGLTPGIEEKVMWISSQTEEEVMRALREAKPVEAYNDILEVKYQNTKYKIGAIFPCNSDDAEISEVDCLEVGNLRLWRTTDPGIPLPARAHRRLRSRSLGPRSRV